MTSPTPDMQAILERMERLERVQRRLKRFALAALMLATALATIYATQPVPQSIDAHMFRVVDDSGKGLVIMGVINGQPSVILYDAQQKPHVVVTVSSEGAPSISLLDAQRNTRASMALNSLGAGMMLTDAGGKSGAVLNVRPEGESGISFLNEKGKALVGLSSSGSPNITLSDPQGFEMDLGSTSKTNLKTGATEQTSAAAIVMFGNDKDHHVIWQAP